jgi:hypothetical protein
MDTEAIVKSDLEGRLRALRDEYDKGQRMLRDLELQRAQLEPTLIRIEGAMTLLQELLGAENGGARAADQASE